MAAKRKKKISLAEFRAWLEGVEELQPMDWSPSLDQWQLTRNKINLIIEPTVTNPTPGPSHQAQARTPQGIAGFPVPGGGTALPPPTPPPSAISEQSVVKTPDIDSSGGYESDFT